MSRTIQLRRAGCTAFALALSLTVLGGPTPVAGAAVGEPSSLSATPAGSSTPVLSWSPASKATGYDVQVDNDQSFGSPEFTLSTTNFRATPTKALRAGENYWRVRAVKGTDTSDWRSGEAFNVSPINVPVPVSPVNGARLAQPENAPLLEWQASPRAVSYTVELDADADFVGAKSYTTKTTSLVVPDPLSVGDWFWRVTAVKGAGLVSLPSQPMSFDILALRQPRLTSPADSVDTKVGDVVVDWEPVSGARSYDVQISDGPDFDPATTTSATGVQGTRYSPMTTLNNEQFWWRVRAVDLNGQATEWSATRFGFERVWGDQPTPVHPLGAPSAPTSLDTDQPFYQWKPVPKATLYELWVSNDRNFTTYDRCRVVGTTYAPRDFADCGYYAAPTVTYWRVRPIDKPYDRDGLPGQRFSPDQAFIWDDPSAPGTFTGFTPVADMKVSVDGKGAGCTDAQCNNFPANPVLSWDPQPGIAFYLVYIGQDKPFTTSVLAPGSVPIRTSNTMLTLEAAARGAQGDGVSVLPDSSAGEAYHWHVRPCVSTTSCAPNPISPDVPVLTKSFVKVSPPVTGLTSTDRMGTEITFSWDEYFASNQATSWNGEKGNQSAKGYHIQVDNEPSFDAPLLDEQTVDQTTYTAFDRLYPEGTLYWRVQATDDEDNALSWSSAASLIKESPAVPLISPAHGATVPGTVPFRWEPQAYAASYTLEVYRNNDYSFSSVNRLFTSTVKTPAYTWTDPIPADPANYLWRVRRTDSDGNPGPWSAPRSFTSLGAVPTLTSPANGAWQPANGPLVTWSDVAGAASYSLRITGATSSLATVATVGNAYAHNREVRTGTYAWSVTALDSAGKPMGTSPTHSFKVDSDSPTVVKIKGTKLTKKKKAKIVAKFSEQVKGVSKRTMKLYKKGSKKALKTKVVYKRNKATLKPKVKLKRGKTYFIKWNPTRIKDVAGNTLDTPKKWKFTVK